MAQGLLDFLKRFVGGSTETLEFRLMTKLTACLIGVCALLLTAGDFVPLKNILCECGKTVKDLDFYCSYHLFRLIMNESETSVTGVTSVKSVTSVTSVISVTKYEL